MSGLGLRAIAEFLMRRGFVVVFIIVFLLFSVVTRHFFEVENILNILSAMAPLAISAAGLALVVMSGRLDISIGSIAFLSCAIVTTRLWRFAMTSGPSVRAHLFMTVSSGTLPPPTRVKER